MNKNHNNRKRYDLRYRYRTSSIWYNIIQMNFLFWATPRPSGEGWSITDQLLLFCFICIFYSFSLHYSFFVSLNRFLVYQLQTYCCHICKKKLFRDHFVFKQVCLVVVLILNLAWKSCTVNWKWERQVWRFAQCKLQIYNKLLLSLANFVKMLDSELTFMFKHPYEYCIRCLSLQEWIAF